MPLIDHLLPDNWNDEDYYKKNPDKRITLPGTANPRRITTQPVKGKSIDIVVKYCRIGQYTDIAVSKDIDFISDEEIDNASWNGPFEEFGLVNEYLSTNNFFDRKIKTQIPLAIYSPEKEYEPWQVQRSKHHFKYHNIALKKSQEVTGDDPIELDIRRLYAMIYLWVEGEDAGVVFQRLKIENELPGLVRTIYNRDIKNRGYGIADTKPDHIIVRTEKDKLVRDKNNDIDYALIDFELLRRTEKCEKIHKRRRRIKYWSLVYHKDADYKIPSDRKIVNIFGVDYVHGTASNGGKLWIVGNNPELFDYFEPTKWRSTPRSRLSGLSSRTLSLDNIQLVYRESRVKFQVPGEANSRTFKYGYNSPFEEVAIADGLRKAGIPVVYPRA
ncbi:MAG: hypothetical protein KAR20_14455, partial [Candidatus Heimdallarchaeota archaeon]|nr:hypothetical protein [Candidatus Heimdallarchaeota archaeon]